MVQTFSDDDKIYSVDMMFAYANIFQHPVDDISIDKLIQFLFKVYIFRLLLTYLRS